MIATIRNLIKGRSPPAINKYEKPNNLNPFWHYQSSFDPADIVKRYALEGLVPTEGRYTNFLGVKVDIEIFPTILPPMSGIVEGIPWPNNWHADLAEFGAALRAVDLAGETFTAVELGCGWACWLNCTGAAARAAGKKVKLIGVEGDKTHVNWANRSLTENGFKGNFEIMHGIAGARAGIALFPNHEGEAWGLQAVFDPSVEQIEQGRTGSSHQVLTVFTFDQIAADHGNIDLLHMDIQGAEADLIESCQIALKRNVRYIVIGTHSREIEGRIEKVMLSNEWLMEMDRPAIISLESGRQTLRVDGVQGWRNPNL